MFRAAGEIRARLGSSGQITLGDDATTARIYFGSAFDTNLYRSGANTLTTDGTLQVLTQIVAKSGPGGIAQ